MICHNDVCPENVVHRDGVAIALLDFEFAAPGRRLYDLAQLAKMGGRRRYERRDAWFAKNRQRFVDVLG